MSAQHAIPAEVRLYGPLFSEEDPTAVESGQTFLDHLSPDSLEVLNSAWVEPSLERAAAGQNFQLERLGYFCVDPDSRPGAIVLNRTVTLRDSWAKIAKKN